MSIEDLNPRPGDLDPIETASVDELRGLQEERLRWSVRHAYENVPHYGKSFDAAGVHPDDIRGLDDLSKLPFTSKADLRANYPFGMFAVPREQVVRIHASSGTTGKPTVVGYTKDDLDMWATVMARSIRASGGRPGHILHNAYGYGLFTGGLGAHYGAEKLGCTVVPVSGGMTERQVQLITDFKPDIIMVTPSYMLSIVDEMEHQGIDPTSTSLKVGEVLPEGTEGAQIEELILATPQLSPHFQCVLDRSGNLDSLTVVVEHRTTVAPDAAAEAGLLLERSVKNSIGVTVGVHVVSPNTVDRSVGKMKRIVDNRPAR